MKKILFLITLVLTATISSADNNTYITVNNTGDGTVRSVYTDLDGKPITTTRTSEYRLDTWAAERRAEEKNAQVGLITRFGYAYNYDAFTYGVSIIYHWDGYLGVTLGFDGYSMSGKTCVGYRENIVKDENGTPVINEDGYIESTTELYVRDLSQGLPLWDARFGLEFGKYFIAGGLLGKTSVDDQLILDLKGEDAWFVNNSGSNFMYGAFVTFMLPISSYVGLNMDFAVTNKTGFNVAAGINITLPLK